MKKFFERNLGFIVCILIIACVIVVEGCLLKAQRDISKLNERLTIVEQEQEKLAKEKVVIVDQTAKEKIVVERVEEKENDIPVEAKEEKTEMVIELEPVVEEKVEVAEEPTVEEKVEVAEEPVVEEKEATVEVEAVDSDKLYTEDEAVDSYKLYTEDDVIAAAKMVWGEAGAVPDIKNGNVVISTKCQQAATIWTALNRYDMGGFNSIKAVIANPGAYHAYFESNPATDELVELARDVLDRWNREKNGETDVGRVLPADYIYFHGDGTHNYFRNEFEGGTRWTWDYGDPYAE